MKHNGLSLCLISVTLIVFTRASDNLIEMAFLSYAHLEDDDMSLLNTVSVEDKRVTLQFQKKCPTRKDKMIQNINEVLQTDVGVSNEECKCVNVKPGPRVKKYRKWYLFKPQFDLPTFIVEFQGPKSNMVKANIEENQMILKEKKYFIVKSVCEICLRDAEQVLLHCNELHMYCAECIPKFEQKRCPLCKEPITIRLFDKICLIVAETIFLPASLFDEYMLSWIQPLLNLVQFARFEDAYWKLLFFSYVRFFAANAVAITVEFLAENCAFDVMCVSTTHREILKSFLQQHFYSFMDFLLFQKKIFIIIYNSDHNLLVDFRWVAYGFVAHNTNRLVKYITGNRVGINISLFAPTIFAMWTPLIGMVSQEIILGSVHTILLVSLLQSVKKHNFGLLVVVCLFLMLLLFQIFIFHMHANSNQFMKELFVLIKFPYRYFFIPILSGLVCSIFLILKNIM